jgi:hypothetical protein
MAMCRYANRLASYQVSFRLTYDERDTVGQAADAVGMSVAGYAKVRAMGGQIKAPVFDWDVAHEVGRAVRLAFWELRRIGNNVNQIAKRLNSAHGPHDCTKAEMDAVRASLESVEDALEAIWQRSN